VWTPQRSTFIHLRTFRVILHCCRNNYKYYMAVFFCSDALLLPDTFRNYPRPSIQQSEFISKLRARDCRPFQLRISILAYTTLNGLLSIIWYDRNAIGDHPLSSSSKILTRRTSDMGILVLRFSRLELNVQLRLSGMSRVECWKLFKVSANIAVAIFRVNVLVRRFS
jgi:hypothetical protein